MTNPIAKKVFGMISYLPDDEPARSLRIERVNRAFDNIVRVFGENVNWIIIAQNWKDYKAPELIASTAKIFYYDKLGILNARKELREKFLESNYDWLIMLDDDCIIEELTDNAGIKYFEALDEHPNGFMFLYDPQRLDYAKAQLNLCAISRDIYNKEPMVEIDAQKGEGYEDFIFSHLLHYKYPSAEFHFNGLKCTQFRNPNEKAPSTWMHEQKGNFRKMDLKSRAIVQSMSRGKYNIENICRELGYSNERIKFPIDFVFPYVNNQDPVWREKYKNFCKEIGEEGLIQRIDTERYFDLGWLVYLFRGIDKFLPFVRNVYMIVERNSQVPNWVDRNRVKIILHSDIIPQRFLPTYNSTTIEMFLHNIPGLSEHFIYGNDDMYPMRLMQNTDFFTISGKPKENFNIYNIDIKNDNMFARVCARGFRDVAAVLQAPIKPGIYIRPEHGLAPFRVSNCKTIISKLGNIIYDNITPFRAENNHNQYIYAYYCFLKKETIFSTRDFAYINLEKNIDKICDAITCGQFDVLCINDNSQTDRDLWLKEGYKVREAFESIFPEKSKFEL